MPNIIPPAASSIANANMPVRISGHSLIECLNKASEALNVSAEYIDFRIVSEQSTSGYVISASRSPSAPVVTATPSLDPANGGLDLRIDLINQKLNSLDLLDINLDGIDLSAIDNAIPETAAENIDDVDENSRDGSFSISISDDKMHVFLNVVPAIGQGIRVTRPLVTEYLRNLKICNGILDEVIEDTIKTSQEENRQISDVEIVTGTLPKNGVDESIEFRIKKPTNEVNFRDDGSIDWRNSAQVVTVKAHELIAVITPAVKGVPGKDIYGQNVPCIDGHQSPVRPGDNVEYNSGTKEIFAKINGVVEIINGCLTVCEIFVVNHDVNIESGNIDFDGEVLIRGSVRSGFSVHATNNITVTGSIEAAEVISREGSVFANTGIAGQGRGFVSAKENVVAKYIENATVYAADTVEVSAAILNSAVTAGKQVVALCAAGSIIGGTTRAGEAIKVKRLGSESETPTLVTVGIAVETYKQIEEIDRKISALQSVAKQIEEILDAAKLRGAEKLSQANQQKISVLQVKFDEITKQISFLRIQRDNHLESGIRGGNGYVDVEKDVFGRVSVHIGRYKRLNRINMHHIKFLIKDDQLISDKL